MRGHKAELAQIRRYISSEGYKPHVLKEKPG